MKCPYCGREIKENAQFCAYCGRQIRNTRDNSNVCPNCRTPLKKNLKKCPVCGYQLRASSNEVVGPPTIVFVLIGVLIAVVLIGAYLFFIRPDSALQPEGSADMSQGSGDMTEDKEDESDQEQVPEQSTSNADDYSTVLDPGKFKVFQSSEDKFYFSYPENFYDHMSETNGELGRSVNFWSDNSDSTASFTYTRRTDDSSLTQRYSNLYQISWDSLYEPEKIIGTENASTGGARFIFSGYEDAAKTVAVYKLVYITDTAEMEMYITYPKETSEEDKNQKWYYVECMYRMCGFSGSSKAVRSYEAYLNDTE